MFYLILLLGFLLNAGVLVVGMAFYKSREKSVDFLKLLLVNVFVSVLALIYGLVGGTLSYVNEPYVVQTVGLMSFGMLAFCMVSLLLFVRQTRS
ncbi:hypothetical protein H0266_15030 [Halobacillus locisalis]|uniref:Uncharacterized protein n=2 Tax=Halobacillus locisalis TaxID=220753 RepID=A0A838CWJ5_9BACI|nr:hypothetical protein [Halobacillus locisalis]